MTSLLQPDRHKHLSWFVDLAVTIAVASLFSVAVHADEASAQPTSAESGLEDLGDELMEEPAETPHDSGAVEAQPQSPRPAGILRRETGAQAPSGSKLAEGEDVGAEQGVLPPNWLQGVEAHMSAAHSLLAARDASGRASAAQQQAIDEIDAMIARLQKECEKCGGQCQKPGTASQQPAKPGNKPGAKPSEAGAAATAETAPSERAAIGELVKDLWGKLPQRQREELLQPLSEEFLPEYAVDIEEYFRAMAEAPEDARATPIETPAQPPVAPQP